METDPVTRFLHALTPSSREAVRALDRDRQEAMAEEWERRLRDETELMTLSELDPPSAETRAAEEVAQGLR
ncbi:hypothetical protein IHE55_25835 [Streptomyces pactum]|uniref:Uncharacterized protein n=1 Tax=Streptomyces pactum TaxID=68249 RepID=A0ABS0NSL1_9ACTN|nr:hypothetical protein [Streptomyces pactum]MBH5338014.1 hypothetical protein [Streptomyces pactum]